MKNFRIGRNGSAITGAVTTFLLAGCNSFDPKPDEGSHLVIPTDERPATHAEQAPPPISGGTLLVSADGKRVLLADPARDSVSVVRLDLGALENVIQLEPGDEPGRLIQDGQGQVHVALRRGGAVVTIDPVSGQVVRRVSVCHSPRGLAYEASTGLLHVACAEGKLVSLDPTSGAVTRSLSLDVDLRDVVVSGSELWVTRFKSAEILRLGADGALGSRVNVPTRDGTIARPPAKTGEGPQIVLDGGLKPVKLQPEVAWRTVSGRGGEAVMVHQLAVIDDLDVPPPSSQGSAYGGSGFGCSGIVQTEISMVASDGAVKSANFAGAPLSVDVALSPDGAWLALASAGAADSAAPRPFEVFPSESGDSGGVAAPASGFAPGGAGAVRVISTSELPIAGDVPCTSGTGGMFIPTDTQVTSVAFAPDGRLLAQSVEPPQLFVLDVGTPPSGTPRIIALPGGSRGDTGHELFHRDAGGGIACASCHPEGGEDGHTWHFTDTGPRRTQPLHVGLRDTAPFHWNGDLKDVGAVMNTVFVGRMGGVHESAERTDALSSWLFALTPPSPVRASSDDAAERGQALFNSKEVGCSSCHSGAKLTDNQSVAVDSAGHKLQVPSLLGVAYRAPFMHDGCAATLTARFDPKCGGNAHGNTSQLSADQVGDLVAFLETL